MVEKDRQSLLGIIEAIDKILSYVSEFKSPDEFFEHTINFDAVLMNFVVVGEMVDRLSEEFKNQYANIDWFKIKGFRNIIAHDYFGVDAEEVWQIIKDHLVELKSDIENILK